MTFLFCSVCLRSVCSVCLGPLFSCVTLFFHSLHLWLPSFLSTRVQIPFTDTSFQKLSWLWTCVRALLRFNVGLWITGEKQRPARSFSVRRTTYASSKGKFMPRLLISLFVMITTNQKLPRNNENIKTGPHVLVIKHRQFRYEGME